MDQGENTEQKYPYTGKDWLNEYTVDLRDAISPEDSKSKALVNIWTGLAHISYDPTVPEGVRGFFATVATSINTLGLNAINKNGEPIAFPKLFLGEIRQTVHGMVTSDHEVPRKPI